MRSTRSSNSALCSSLMVIELCYTEYEALCSASFFDSPEP